jgi:diacylglycerol kinase (ATP)
MRVILLHNPGAGEGRGGRRPTARSLRDQLEHRGYDVTYVSTDDDEAKRRTKEPADLVVAAGGDGTVARVARWLAGRETPLAILPLGTANNIAGALGIAGSTRELIASWDLSRTRRFDVGRVRWGDRKPRKFVEGVGTGWFATVLRDAEARERSAERMAQHTNAWVRSGELLAGTRGEEWRIVADDGELSGRWLAVEVMNISMIGSRLALAPGADPGDGLLDLVLIGEKERGAVMAYLDARRRGVDEPLALPSRRCARVVLTRLESAAPTDLHIDDTVRTAAGEIEIGTSGAQVDILAMA